MNKILIIAEYYKPGYQAGGPIKSIYNLANELKNDFEVYIVTRNHDLKTKKPYNLKSDTWLDSNGINIFYCSDNFGKNTLNQLKIDAFDYIYMNSFFSKITIKFLLKKKNMKNIIISPRGELGEGALKIKKMKKIIFIYLSKLLGLYKNVKFIVSSELEFIEVNKFFKYNKKNIASNISDLPDYSFYNNKKKDILNLFFVSRVTPKKNIDFLLTSMKNIKGSINIKIIGPIEDEKYYQHCMEIAKELPKNIVVKFKGSINPEKIYREIKEDDYFILPTLNENYGHVIAESLIYKKPVLLSDQTPWTEYIEQNKLGYIIPLDIEKWETKIKCILKEEKEYEQYKEKFDKVHKYLQKENEKNMTIYRRIFNG